MQTRITIIACILLLFFIGTTVRVTSMLNVTRNDRDRISRNFDNANKTIDSITDKNGTYHYASNSLMMKLDEFKKYNEKLSQDIKDMGIKLKNIKATTNIYNEYNYIIDSTKTKKVNDSTFLCSYNDNYIQLNERVRLVNGATNVVVDSIHIKTNDSLLMVYETTYKRKFIFWKKAIGVKVHVKSSNPHFVVDKIENIEFDK